MAQNDTNFQKIIQAKKSGTSSTATDETQRNMRRAIKEIEEHLAMGSHRQLTGLQKWQLAVKFLAMNQKDIKYDYLDRHNKYTEFDISGKMSIDV